MISKEHILMLHVNYYQVFQLVLQKDDVDMDRISYANNNIILGIITLIGENEFNEWYSNNIEKASAYSKLTLTERLNQTSSDLHTSLVTQTCFNLPNKCRMNVGNGIETKTSGETLEMMLYHALTVKSNFWIIHESIITDAFT